jgi:hypothetical protein
VTPKIVVIVRVVRGFEDEDKDEDDKEEDAKMPFD